MRKTKRIRHIVYNRFVPSPPQGNPERNFPVELPPLGEGFGRGLYWWLFLYRRKPDLFERPKAAFFTVVADGVMHRMTVGMVETARRKTRFPTVGTAIHAKVKPPSATRLFVFISSPLMDAKNSGEDT